MANRDVCSRVGMAAILTIGGYLCGATGAKAQAKTNLKKVLVLDQATSPHGHFESRRDLNAALRALATEKGFALTIIGQNDPASKVTTEFSTDNLSTYQAVIFSNNDGVDTKLDAASKTNFETYVKNGGGFVAIHAASAFISNWSWINTVLVERFFGPHGSDRPTANVLHDAEGNKEGTETKGIFKGLTAPLAFMDEYYSFQNSPRGKPGVTILLTVDEATFSKPVQGKMGADHPVVWSKTEGKGRVVHQSMGHSWDINNVYAAKNSYLKNFLYNSLRYVSGDFLGCSDIRYVEYNADATKNDPTACKTLVTSALTSQDGLDAGSLFSRQEGSPFVKVAVQSAGPHQVTMLDVSGRSVHSRSGTGRAEYSLPMPSNSGIYTVVSRAGGKESRYRVTVL